MGVEVDACAALIFFATSVMIGAAVSVSGIISFVGLIVPHMLRTAIGADHRLLLPASLIGGAAFMVPPIWSRAPRSRLPKFRSARSRRSAAVRFSSICCAAKAGEPLSL